MTDDENPDEQLDKELGTPDPEATADEAMGTLDPTAGAPAAPGAEPGTAELAPPQVQAPQVPPPPGLVPAGTHAVKGTQTVTALQPNADMAQGHADEMKVFGDERKLAGDQAALQGKAAEIEQQRAEKIADETARQNAEALAQQQYQADQQAQRNAQMSRDIEQLRAQKPPGGMSEWGGGKRTLASLSIALGGLVAGRNGTANFAMQDVQRKIDNEQKQYQLGIENQYKALGARQGLNHEIDNQEKDELARGEARKLLAIESLNKYADAQLKALGVPAAAQAGVKAQLGFDKQAAEAQQKYGQLLASKVTDATRFAPGKAGAGGGAPNDALSKLHEFARTHTGPDQEAQVVAQAERLFPGLGAKPEKLQQLVAGAVKASADAKNSADDKVVTLDNGEQLALPSARAVPQFVKGYGSRIQAAEKIRKLLADVKENGASPYGIDATSRRKSLIDDANSAVASITPMGQSDHSTHIELGTLGAIQPRQIPFFHPSDKLGIETLEAKLNQVTEGTEREIHTFRKNAGAFKPGGDKGETGGAVTEDPMPAGFTKIPARGAK